MKYFDRKYVGTSKSSKLKESEKKGDVENRRQCH